MKSVDKSMLIWFSAAQMYDLVRRVDLYPQFLPWCKNGRIVEETDLHMIAQVEMAFAGVKQQFTTHNTHIPDRQIKLALVDGPFSHLQGQWDFSPIESQGVQGSRVHLRLQYAFSNPMLASLVGPVFGKIAQNLVDAFVQRANVVYGGNLK